MLSPPTPETLLGIRLFRLTRQNRRTCDIGSASHPRWAVICRPSPGAGCRPSDFQDAAVLSRSGLLPAFRVKPHTALVATVKHSTKSSQYDFLVKPTSARAMKIIAATSGACNKSSALSGNVHRISTFRKSAASVPRSRSIAPESVDFLVSC